ncbi:MAG: hypothetical protein EOP22_14495 [Hyphomicrobiales bacterium]|nr:MAG: hypothetical protein EOP22_14495 [Hyphomicrobiales bacterium]
MMTVRENGVTREISVVQGIELAQQKSALGGSSLAQKHFLDRHRAAEIERRAELEAEIEWGQSLIDDLIWMREVSAARGVETPMPYPHPDDIVIDQERGVRFVGPTSAEEDARLKWALRARDVLLAQDAFDCRCWNAKDDDGTDTRPGTAAVLAWLINAGVPKRYRLSEIDVIMMTFDYDRMTKRAFAKYLCQAWKGLGLAIPRGTSFVSIGKGARLLETVFGMLVETDA